MAIAVVCPGCKKAFRVSDKFAGQKGPCPNCKTVITIPKIEGEKVVVHSPEQHAAGGKDAVGRPVLKPISRPEMRLRTPLLIVICGGSLLVFAASWVFGSALRQTPLLGIAGLAVLSPFLTLGAYSFLRDDELAPHSGLSLWVRTGICSIVYTALWIAFHFVPLEFKAEIWQWLFIVLPFLAVGTFTALGCYDLDATNGFFHYASYLLVTGLLHYTAGMPLWQPPPS
jgi:hypothetical protein